MKVGNKIYSILKTMKHLNKNRKLGRKRGPRRALLKSLIHNLINSKKIKTTEAKAKEMRPLIEKLITRARKNSIANRRLVFQKLASDNDVKKMFDEIAPKYKERQGGYVRIIKTTPRKSDVAKMAFIEFV